MEPLTNEILKKIKIKIKYSPVRVPSLVSKEFDSFVGKEIVALYNDGEKMHSYLTRIQASENPIYFSDYSFVVFPNAKAYEGVLKKILLDAKLIKESELLDDPTISINKYFNPVGNSSIFDSLKDKTRDKAIPYVIYSVYQECRNEIIHYDPYKDNRITSLEEARFYQERIEDATLKAYNTFKK